MDVVNSVPSGEFNISMTDRQKIINMYTIMRSDFNFQTCSDKTLILGILYKLIRHNFYWFNVGVDDVGLLLLVGLSDFNVSYLNKNPEDIRAILLSDPLIAKYKPMEKANYVLGTIMNRLPRDIAERVSPNVKSELGTFLMVRRENFNNVNDIMKNIHKKNLLEQYKTNIFEPFGNVEVDRGELLANYVDDNPTLHIGRDEQIYYQDKYSGVLTPVLENPSNMNLSSIDEIEMLLRKYDISANEINNVVSGIKNIPPRDERLP